MPIRKCRDCRYTHKWTMAFAKSKNINHPTLLLPLPPLGLSPFLLFRLFLLPLLFETSSDRTKQTPDADECKMMITFSCWILTVRHNFLAKRKLVNWPITNCFEARSLDSTIGQQEPPFSFFLTACIQWMTNKILFCNWNWMKPSIIQFACHQNIHTTQLFVYLFYFTAFFFVRLRLFEAVIVRAVSVYTPPYVCLCVHERSENETAFYSERYWSLTRYSRCLGVHLCVVVYFVLTTRWERAICRNEI